MKEWIVSRDSLLGDTDLRVLTRCKDCAFCEEIDFGLFICHNQNLVIVGSYVDGNWFCADGYDAEYEGEKE